MLRLTIVIGSKFGMFFRDGLLSTSIGIITKVVRIEGHGASVWHGHPSDCEYRGSKRWWNFNHVSVGSLCRCSKIFRTQSSSVSWSKTSSIVEVQNPSNLWYSSQDYLLTAPQKKEPCPVMLLAPALWLAFSTQFVLPECAHYVDYVVSVVFRCPRDSTRRPSFVEISAAFLVYPKNHIVVFHENIGALEIVLRSFRETQGANSYGLMRPCFRTRKP
jgi:hypothetical protein